MNLVRNFLVIQLKLLYCNVPIDKPTLVPYQIGLVNHSLALHKTSPPCGAEFTYANGSRVGQNRAEGGLGEEGLLGGVSVGGQFHSIRTRPPWTSRET